MDSSTGNDSSKQWQIWRYVLIACTLLFGVSPHVLFAIEQKLGLVPSMAAWDASVRNGEEASGWLGRHHPWGYTWEGDVVVYCFASLFFLMLITFMVCLYDCSQRFNAARVLKYLALIVVQVLAAYAQLSLVSTILD